MKNYVVTHKPTGRSHYIIANDFWHAKNLGAAFFNCLVKDIKAKEV